MTPTIIYCTEIKDDENKEKDIAVYWRRWTMNNLNFFFCVCVGKTEERRKGLVA